MVRVYFERPGAFYPADLRGSRGRGVGRRRALPPLRGAPRHTRATAGYTTHRRDRRAQPCRRGDRRASTTSLSFPPWFMPPPSLGAPGAPRKHGLASRPPPTKAAPAPEPIVNRPPFSLTPLAPVLRYTASSVPPERSMVMTKAAGNPYPRPEYHRVQLPLLRPRPGGGLRRRGVDARRASAVSPDHEPAVEDLPVSLLQPRLRRGARVFRAPGASGRGRTPGRVSRGPRPPVGRRDLERGRHSFPAPRRRGLNKNGERADAGAREDRLSERVWTPMRATAWRRPQCPPSLPRPVSPLGPRSSDEPRRNACGRPRPGFRRNVTQPHTDS